MAAYDEEKVPVDEEAEQRQRSIMDEYKQKLIVCGRVMPDPFSLQDGWLAEKKGTGFLLNLLVTYTLQNPICEIRIYVYATLTYTCTPNY